MSTEIEAEYRALTGAWGVAEAAGRARLELAGADRERFLNGLVTCEVKDLAAGEGRHGFLTSAQGKVLADCVVLALDGRLRLELPAAERDAIAEHLAKYVVADRVEIERGPELATLVVAGPAADEGLAARLDGGALPTAAWGHGEVEIGGVAARAVRHPRLGVPGFWLTARAGDAILEALTDAGRGGPARPVGREALAALRVERGIPAFGREFGPDNFPQETGLQDAVSYTKGCYLGQEVVARIHYRGQVNRVLRGLAVDGESPLPEGAAIVFDGREAGRVTSATRSPRLGRPVALTLIHRRAAEPGTEVEVEGAAARVVELPFA